MKESPILFSGPMVRALLDGTKTQTRRVVKFPKDSVLEEISIPWMRPTVWLPDRQESVLMDCPYGKPGDRLWVRECWSSDFAGHYPHDRVWYRADDHKYHDIDVRDGVRGIYSPESDEFVPFRWHPSIHMPRAACRLVLEIVSIRVERLNDITDDDARAEGVAEWSRGVMTERERHEICRQDGFRMLWESINGVGSWATNPWVWVVEFRRA